MKGFSADRSKTSPLVAKLVSQRVAMTENHGCHLSFSKYSAFVRITTAKFQSAMQA